MSDDLDFNALRPTSRSKAAAGVSVMAGFVTLLLANQTNTIIRFEGMFALLILLQFVLGAGFLVCGYFVLRMRGWAVWSTMGVGALTAVTSAGWLVFTLANGVVSLMPLLVVPLTAFAGFLAYTSKDDIALAEEARRRMEESGMDLGV